MKQIFQELLWIVAFVAICVVVSVCWNFPKDARAEPIDTYHSGWHLVRETASEDGATFAAVYDLTGVGATNGAFGSRDSTGVLLGGAFRIPTAPTDLAGLGASAGTKWAFSFSGENFNNIDDTFSFRMVGWTKDNGMLQTICEGDCVLGTQAVAAYPDDAGDAFGRTISLTGVTYTNGTTTFTDTDDVGGFDGAAVGMLARVTGTDLTDEIVQVTTVTDANIIICSGVTSTDNNTDSTVQINPAFWADTINLDDQTRWAGSLADPNTETGYYQMEGTLALINAGGNNEVASLVVDLTGLEWIQFVVYDADAATAEQAGNITVFGRRY